MDNEDKELKALNNFEDNTDCLKKLNKWTNDVNFFSIAGIERMEIKHSNFIAWLFNPKANHNLGGNILKEFVINVLQNDQDKCKTIDKIDFDSFDVRREWQHFDLCLISQKSKFIIVIENKIGACERENQTIDYKNTLNKYYGDDYKKLFIFLTANGDEPQDNNWRMANYENIISAIKTVFKTNQVSSDVKLIIENYIMTLGRYVIMDKEKENKCFEIYNEYKDALDLIYDCVKNTRQNFYNFIEDFIKENAERIEFDENDCTKKYIRFTTNYIDGLLQIDNTAENKFNGWKNGKKFMYEILVDDEINFFATIANPEDDTCKKIFKISQEHKDEFNLQDIDIEKLSQWSRALKTKEPLVQKNEMKNGLESNKEKLTKNLKDLFGILIPNFEKKIAEKLPTLKND